VLQCVAVCLSLFVAACCNLMCCSVLQCVAVCCTPHHQIHKSVAVCCSVLQCVAVCCSALHTTSSDTQVCCSMLQCVACTDRALESVTRNTCYPRLHVLWQRVAVCCSVAACCSVIQIEHLGPQQGTSSPFFAYMHCYSMLLCVAVCYWMSGVITVPFAD